MMVLILGALVGVWERAAVDSIVIVKKIERSLQMGLVMPKTVLFKPMESSQNLTT
jgi:hypothetical protein